MKLSSEYIETIRTNNVDVDVYGCRDNETNEGEYDYVDFFVEGECINLGDPCYAPRTKWLSIINLLLK